MSNTFVQPDPSLRLDFHPANVSLGQWGSPSPPHMMVLGSLPGTAFPLQSAFPGGPCEVSYDPDWEVPECHKLHIHLVKKILSAAHIEGQKNQSPPLM